MDNTTGWVLKLRISDMEKRIREAKDMAASLEKELAKTNEQLANFLLEEAGLLEEFNNHLATK